MTNLFIFCLAESVSELSRQTKQVYFILLISLDLYSTFPKPKPRPRRLTTKYTYNIKNTNIPKDCKTIEKNYIKNSTKE